MPHILIFVVSSFMLIWWKKKIKAMYNLKGLTIRPQNEENVCLFVFRAVKVQERH